MNNLLDDIELPESVMDALYPKQDTAAGEQSGSGEGLTEHMRDLTQILTADRKRCIDGRRMSGIEDVWRKCEDNYAAIDEVTGQSAAVVR